MNYRELQKKLKKLGLKASGTKAELEKRLAEAQKPARRRPRKEAAPKKIFYDNCEILKVKESGHTATHFLCLARTAGGDTVTILVPKSKFNG